jgi:hypothetical protein
MNVEKRNTYMLLGRKPDGKRPIGTQRQRFMDNIKMCLEEIGWYMDWTGVAQVKNQWGAFVNAVINLQVPHNAESLKKGSPPLS